MQHLASIWHDTRTGTLGRRHLIAFFGSGSSGIPMDVCWGGKQGSANNVRDFRHFSSRVWKSWSMNLIGFAMEPGVESLSVAMLPMDPQSTWSEQPSLKYRSKRTPSTRTVGDTRSTSPALPTPERGVPSAAGRRELQSGVMTRCQQPLSSSLIYHPVGGNELLQKAVIGPSRSGTLEHLGLSVVFCRIQSGPEERGVVVPLGVGLLHTSTVDRGL